MFGIGKRRKQQAALDAQYRKDMRAGALELARVIAEEGLTGARREQALAKIAEAERKLDKS